MGFTPHDPTEDTESVKVRIEGGEELLVSPLTIRQRILKARLVGRVDSATAGFTPHDPTEDTERLLRLSESLLLHAEFHPSRSDRGY